MHRTPFLPNLFRRSLAASTACLALGALAVSCGSSSAPCEDQDHFSSSVVSTRLSATRGGGVDLLLDIDNSRGMADKQLLLSLAVRDLVQGLVNPPCVDAATGAIVTTPEGPLADCPAGTERKTEPVRDLHVGVISTSLGGHGSDACASSGAGKASSNDKAHLLDRKDPTLPDKVATYQDFGFLAWDPQQKLVPPGEGDIDADSAGDPNNTALVPQLQDLVMGAGEIGCGYEAQLESWYRFLVDPSPVDSITLDAKGTVVLNDVDKMLLAQRKHFLRPDSVLAILMLTDENDCSIRESGQFYFAAQQKTSDGSPFHLPKARPICEQDPNNECCFSCGQKGPKDEAGNYICPDDPACKTPDGKTVYLDATTDNINLRCYQQKRRFGIDFLYGTDRYQKALTNSTVTDRNGNVVQNPIFSDLDQSDSNTNIRTSSMVILAGLVGVPWQDIARTNANGEPDLKTGIDSKGEKSGGFKSALEMAQTLPGKDFTTWDVVLGNPSKYPSAEALPKDPLMLESVDPRAGANPITGDPLVPAGQVNPINGNEWTIVKHDELQYACIFPIVKVDQATGNIVPETRDCSVPGKYAGCDCEDATNDNPLCQPAAGGGNTDQTKAKAYPGLRVLQVLKDLGDQGVVGSVCPAQLSQLQEADFGYRPAMTALVDRVVSASSASCLQPTLSAGDDGRVTCVVLEAKKVDSAQASACNACAADGRDAVSDAHKPIEQEVQESNPSAGYNCFCEIPQLEGNAAGQPLWACQNDPSNAPVTQSGAPVDGYCYLDASQGLGSSKLLEACPEGEQRLIRFTGAGAPSAGGTVFLMCVVEHPLSPTGECANSP